MRLTDAASSVPSASQVLRASAPLLTMLAGALAVLTAEATAPSIIGMLLGTAALWMAALTASLGHRLGWLAPARIFLAGATLYIVPALLTVLMVGALTSAREVDSSLVRVGGQMSVTAFGWAAVGIGAVGLLGEPRASPVGSDRWLKVPLLGASFLLGGAGVVAVGAFVAIVGFDALVSVGYGERYQLMAGYGALILGTQTVTLATLAGSSAASNLGRPGLALTIALAGLLFQAGWAGLVGARSALVQLALGLAVLWYVRGGGAAWKLGVVGVTVFAAGTAIGVVRAGIGPGRDLTASGLVALANPASSEFGAPLPTIGEIANAVPAQIPFRLGETYLTAFGVVVPRWAWPTRPLGAAEWYAARFYPQVADVGGAFAFSPVAEAYLNFGRAGIAGVFLLVGVLVGLADRFFRILRRTPFAIGYAVLALSLLIFSRLDAATLLKSHLALPLGQLAVLLGLARLIGLVRVPPRRAAQ